MSNRVGKVLFEKDLWTRKIHDMKNGLFADHVSLIILFSLVEFSIIVN